MWTRTLKIAGLLLASALVATGCTKTLEDAHRLNRSGKAQEAMKVAYFYLGDGSAEVRLETIQLIASAGAQAGPPETETAAEKLLPLFEDEAQNVKIAAIQTVGRFGYAPAAERMLALLPDANAEVRSAMAKAIARTGGDATKAAVAAFDKEPTSQLLRGFLVQIGPAIAPALADSLRGKTARANAAKFEILVDIQSPKAAELMIPYVDDEELSPQVKTGLIKLGEMAVEAIIEALGPRKDQPTRSMGNRALIEALGEIRSAKAGPILEIFAKSNDAMIAAAADRALTMIRGF